MTASRTLVDPELLPGLDQFPAFTFSEEVIAAIRSSEPTELPCPRPRCACTVEPVTVPGPPGAPPVTALLFTPAQRDATCGAYPERPRRKQVYRSAIDTRCQDRAATLHRTETD